MRILTQIRQILADNTDLRLEIEKIKKKLDNHDKNMEAVFRYLGELIEKKDSRLQHENALAFYSSNNQNIVKIKSSSPRTFKKPITLMED